jgi:hypothetical protein
LQSGFRGEDFLEINQSEGGSVLSFFKAEWKVSDTGSAHWASSLFTVCLSLDWVITAWVRSLLVLFSWLLSDLIQPTLLFPWLEELYVGERNYDFQECTLLHVQLNKRNFCNTTVYLLASFFSNTKSRFLFDNCIINSQWIK